MTDGNDHACPHYASEHKRQECLLLGLAHVSSFAVNRGSVLGRPDASCGNLRKCHCGFFAHASRSRGSANQSAGNKKSSKAACMFGNRPRSGPRKSRIHCLFFERFHA